MKDMKKIVLMSAMAVLTLSVTAQDDMYFVPTKKNVEKSAASYGMPEKTYYSGCRQSVDEYNRMAVRNGSSVTAIDSTGNDIVGFDAVQGVYPDSMAQNGDYTCTRRMSRFDDYSWRDPYWDGYYAGRASSLWYDPWYSPYWYDSWYGWGWPYYGYYSSWYWNDPWYWGGWHGHYYHHPIYIGGVGHGYYGGARRYGRITSSGPRTGGFCTSAYNGRSGNARGSYRNSNATFGGQRTNRTSTYSAPRSSSFNRSSGSTFGSSRSSGSIGGGSRSGGFGGGGGSRGGGFGGRR